MNNKKVLVLGSDENVLSSLRSKLSVSGFLVDGEGRYFFDEDLFRHIMVDRPDFIVFEDSLDVDNSSKFLYNIRSNAYTNHIPVFVITNDKVKNENNSLAISKHSDFYFLKIDFDFDCLVDRILRIIKNRNNCISIKNCRLLSV